jgi:hypothetical protein
MREGVGQCKYTGSGVDLAARRAQLRERGGGVAVEEVPGGGAMVGGSLCFEL